ncbi:MAG: glycosyltransferase family A protein [Pseudohaliea sp.]
MKLSIVLVRYGMQRELPRTLESLARDYQLDAASLDYEILLVDNGSPAPLALDDALAARVPLRQFSVPEPEPSPVMAVNLGAAEARGELLCIMIDGAHLLTPGVFRWSLRAAAAFAEPVIAVRYFYLGPGDQPETVLNGYDQAREDRLLARIDWPADGYRLFEVGAPLRGGASHTTWFNRMFESNCLILRRELFERLGGLDPRFDLPGGGFANLDFFKRASEAAGAELVQLVGEGSFHQVHGGATTNSGPERRAARLEAYREQYRALRGNSEFTTAAPLNFLGHLPTEAAKIHRRRPQQAAVSAPAAPSG